METAKASLLRDSSTGSSLTSDADIKHHVAKRKSAVMEGSIQQLGLGLLCGVIFGFLLQKGGVAKYHVLMGVLLLKDSTVIVVMLSAIVVGMVGVYALHILAGVKLHLKPTRYAANIIGGLVFGVGFGLSGYCPGTGSAALGQGNYDAFAMIMGMLAGSYLYAEMSAFLSRSLLKWGDQGKVTLPELVRMSPPVFIAIFAVIIVGVLAMIARASGHW